MSDANGKRLRVAQWATGTVGANAMRAVIEHPAMELVGARVYSVAKDGIDVGEICDLPPVGVRATRDSQAILELKPDCIVYMPESTNLDDVCAILAAGINIVTTRTEFFNPEMLDADVRERIDAACAEGNASLHATGSSPGFITEVLPIAFASVARRIDFIAMEEYADCLIGCSEEMLRDVMGFGDTPEEFARRQTPDHVVFRYSLASVATAMNLPIERFETEIEGAACRTDTKLHKSVAPAGTIGAQRVAITGFHAGKPLMRFRSNWFVTTDVEPAWELRKDGWRLTVEGDTPFDMMIDMPMPQGGKLLPNARYTAHRPVNAIPYVVAAAPGIVTTTQLPQVIAQFA